MTKFRRNKIFSNKLLGVAASHFFSKDLEVQRLRSHGQDDVDVARDCKHSMQTTFLQQNNCIGLLSKE